MAAVTHWSAPSHAVGASVGTGQLAGSAPGGQKPHGSPQAFPVHPQDGGGAGAPQSALARATQRPDGSHAFTNCASTQLGSPGAQRWHESPHAFPAHGS